MAVPKIGILTSIKFDNTTLKTNFETGFSSTFGANPTYATGGHEEANGKYDSAGGKIHKNLNKGARRLNKDADIVVALGGLVAAHAGAKLVKDKPLLVLIGRVPEKSDFDLTDNENYLGGVDLHTAQNNVDRREALMAKYQTIKHNPENVWLLYNPNARMADSEVTEWTAHGGKALPAMATGDNDTTDFAPAFARLNNKGANGVIVSADPFFTLHKDDLVAAANGVSGNIKACYPLKIYKDAATAPIAGTAIVRGADLEKAYETIGKKAGKIASDLQAGTDVKFAGLDPAEFYSLDL
jgi:hypothetical protein